VATVAGLAPIGLIVGVTILASSAAGTVSASAAVAMCGAQAPGATGAQAGTLAGLGTAQVANAQIIYEVSVSLGLPGRAAVIAEATALQESDLVNITNAVDHDSLGLFQQRPSAGWGTAAELSDPVYASTAFYKALVEVPDWQTLPLTVAAQDVQDSAYPDAYAKWETLADQLVEQFGGDPDQVTSTASTTGTTEVDSDCLGGGDGQAGTANPTSSPLPDGFSLPAGTPAAVVTAVDYVISKLGDEYVYGATGPDTFDCSGLVQAAYAAAGVSLPRTTYTQVAAGTAVSSAADLKPGDLVFIMGSDPEGNLPGHVGMYIGDGLVIDAPHTGAVVHVSSYAQAWASQVVAIRRIVSG
jgi:cell wall-associated NlpC family hydrolase